MPLTAASLGRKLPGFRRGNGGYGGGQWKRWGCSMEKMGMLNGKAPSCLRCREIEVTIRQREKMLQMAMFFRTPVGHRCSEQMGTASGKDGDAQWKRWGRPVEKMGTASGI